MEEILLVAYTLEIYSKNLRYLKNNDVIMKTQQYWDLFYVVWSGRKTYKYTKTPKASLIKQSILYSYNVKNMDNVIKCTVKNQLQ